MVYESGFTTRRTYSSRPVTTSYAVTYPSVQKVTRVYKTSYPIYSSYSIPRRIVTGSRVISSPVRVVTSPARVVSRVIHSPSPVRVVRTTTRVVSSPERTYSYTSPSTYYSPTSYLPSSYYTSTYTPSLYTTYTPSYYYNPTTITRVYARSASPSSLRITTSPLRVTPSYLKRFPPGYGERALTNYLNTEPFTTFSEETSRIRHRAQSLMRDVHTPVVRRARSCTPFPVTGYNYGPTSQLALDAYVARVTNPVRHIAKEVHNISYYPRPAVKYVDAELDPNRPTRKFSAPRPLEDAIDLESKEKQRLRQERLLTVNEEALDELEVEKKRVQRADEAKRQAERAVEEEKKRLQAVTEEKRRQAEQQAQAAAQAQALEAERIRIAREEEASRLQAEQQAQAAAEARALEEERNRIAAEEEAKRLEAEQAAAQAKALEEEKQRIAAEEEAKRIEAEQQAQAAALKAKQEEEERLAQEQRVREEELSRLAEIEKQAEEERESEIARQAAELAEIAREEAAIAAQELQAIQNAEPIVEEPVTPVDDVAEQALPKTEREAAEPLVDEAATTVEEVQQEPIIELNTHSEDNTAAESYDENADDDDEEEEEE